MEHLVGTPSCHHEHHTSTDDSIAISTTTLCITAAFIVHCFYLSIRLYTQERFNKLTYLLRPRCLESHAP